MKKYVFLLAFCALNAMAQTSEPNLKWGKPTDEELCKTVLYHAKMACEFKGERIAMKVWEGRFKSVLIEGGEYLRAVVNYIHMNPVRAKIVPHASQYAWSALGAASLGDAFALKGLSLVGVGLEGLSPQEAGVRDRRLSNGVILGSLGFVRRFGAMFAFGFGRRGRRIVSFSRHGTDLYATHGQHSAPKVA